MLLLIGALFLWRNLHPETPILHLIGLYWPFLLIGWGVLRLIEALAFRKRGYYSFAGGEVVLIILICVAGSGFYEFGRHPFRFNGHGLDVFGEQYDYQVSATGSAAGMKRITFENPRGNIKITGGDAQEVTVSGHKSIRSWSRQDAERTDHNTPLEIVPQGDRLLVRTNQDRVPDDQRIADDIEVTVPRGITVEARGRTGDYEVTDVTGSVELASDRADVRLARVGGDVRLEIGRSELIRALDLKGKLDLQGRGSEIDLENIEGPVTISGSYQGTVQFKKLAKPLQFEGARNTELHVQAVPGRMSMDLSELNASGVVGPMRLITRSRDVRLEQFSKSLELETERGDITLQPSLPLSTIEVRAGTGKIDLILPDKATFDLEAVAKLGEAYNGFGRPVEQDREGRSATLKGKVGDGPAIRLTANRGTVSVRKEGSSPEDVPDGKPGKGSRKSTDLKDSEEKM
jgi:DUF4097 and DUF4098 domain-containing protein YvlB